MNMTLTPSPENRGPTQEDLRHRVAALLLDRIDAIVGDVAGVFPYSGADEAFDQEYGNRLGRLLLQLLAFAVRDGRLDLRGGLIASLQRTALERRVTMPRLFSFAYLLERTALDEIALDAALGATSEPWPVVAQLVRRASFDMLGAYAEHAQIEPAEPPMLDRLTTLHARAMFDVVLANEAERASRYGYPLALILFDVDDLAAINREHGYGIGDRVLERLGILIRRYFRQHDWVARHAEDSIAVLLTRADAEHAGDLAERVRSMVVERFGSADRADRAVPVTVSAGVVNVRPTIGDVIDPERLLADAEAGVERAKQLGRNRVVTFPDTPA